MPSRSTCLVLDDESDDALSSTEVDAPLSRSAEVASRVRRNSELEPEESTRCEPHEGDTLLERFRLEGLIAHGGMGDVYRGEHLSLGHSVAIKVLRREYWDHPQIEALFEQEARLGARLGGEYAPRVFDFGRSGDDAPFIVSELLEGVDMRTFLDRSGILPLDYVLHLFLAICDAVAAVHDNGVVHRDIKPANLFLATDPDRGTCLKILDFGISKPLDAADVCSDSDFCAGSPVYMSPEQTISPDTVDVRTDIWSLGIVLYEMLVGFTPAESTSLMGFRLGTGPAFEAPSHARAGVPAELDAIVMRCLARSRDLRYSSVAELRNAASSVLDAVNASKLQIGAMPANDTPRGPEAKTKPRPVRKAAFHRLTSWVKHGPFTHAARTGV